MASVVEFSTRLVIPNVLLPTSVTGTVFESSTVVAPSSPRMSDSTNVAGPGASVPGPALITFVATANQLIVQVPLGRMKFPPGSVQVMGRKPELWTTVPWTKSARSRTGESSLPVFCSTAAMFVMSGWGSVPSVMASVVLLSERLEIVRVIPTSVTGTLS